MDDITADCELRNAAGETVKGSDVLADFYEQLGNEEFEIIFISADKSEKALMNYYRDAHGKWLYLPFGSHEIDTLWNRYGIRTMPTLVILRPGGEVVTRNGVSHVKRRTPQETLRQWKSGEIVEKKSKCSIM